MKKFGIDISAFQNGISFKKIKKEKVKFIMLRAGYTGSSNGVSKAIDSSFKSFYKKANKYNIPVGCYWFSRATSYEKGKSEAKYLYKNCLKGRKFSYPIAIDVEDPIYQEKASKKDVTNAIIGFSEYLEAKGYYVTIYASLDWFNNKMKLSKLKKYDKWVADWGTSNPKSPKHGMWQFGGSTNYIRSTKIDGFTVDQDYAYKDYENIIKNKGLNGYKKNSKKKKSTKKTTFSKGKYITLDYMNIRKGPGTNYKIIKVYKKGKKFKALDIVNKTNSIWAKIKDGYICLKLKNEVYAKKV